MTTVTIYKSEACGVCHEVVPAVKALAKSRGANVRVVDVDQCHTDKCNRIEYTPYVEVDGRQVEVSQLERVL